MWSSNDTKKMNVSISAADETESNLAADNNIRIDNSKSLSGGGGKIDSSAVHSGVDSGFLSGPQLEGCEIDYDEDEESEIRVDSTTQTTSPTTGFSIADTSYIDSGCIEEEDLSTSPINHRVDKGTETDPSGNMILDSGIDSGLTEWFCNLSLKTNQPVNNLGSTQPSPTTADIKSVRDTNLITLASQNKKWELYYTQNNDGDTQLHLACITGYVNVIAALIRMAPHPCLLDIQNDEAQSALHIATLTAQPLVIRMLLVAGAEPTLRDRNGNTPLHLACISGDLQCVKALTIPISSSELQEAQRLTTISSSNSSSTKNNITERTTTSQQYFPCAQLPTDLEIRNYDGERCVHLAAHGSHIEVLRHLVWFGADINAREGKSGRTPLHISIEQCNEILANFLLEECQQKINLETVTYSGLTPYQFACIVQNQKLQIDLEKSGAAPLTPPESDSEGSDIESEFEDSQVSLPVN